MFKSYIASSIPYKGGSTRRGAGSVVYKLSSNENPLGPSPIALQAIREALPMLHEYNFEGDVEFRQAISECVWGKGSSVGPEQIITANSGLELLDLICRGFVDEGSEVILCSPTFMAYENFAHLSGGKAIDIPLLEPGYRLDIEGVLRAVTSKTSLLFISNPNNPTGSLITRREMDVLMERLPGHVTVVYDEVYHHFVTSTDYPRASDYIAQGRPVVALHSFSKAYGLAGIRLGYAFSTPAIAKYLQRIRRPFMINTLSMLAGMAALKDVIHLRETQELVKKEKLWLYSELSLLGFTFWRSEANFILFRSPVPVATFVQEMLDYGIMVRGTDALRAPGCVRVSIGTPEANQSFIEGCRKISSITVSCF